MGISMRSSVTALLLVTLSVSTRQAAAADGWDWSDAPYVWAPSIGVDLREGQPPAENQQRFDDWIDKLEFAFLGHVEGQGDRFGIFGDFIYLALGDSRDYPCPLLAVRGRSPSRGRHSGGNVRFRPKADMPLYESQASALEMIRSYSTRSAPLEFYEVLEQWLRNIAKNWEAMNLAPLELQSLQEEALVLLKELERLQAGSRANGSL